MDRGEGTMNISPAPHPGGSPQCPTCGRPLPRDTATGLCPVCALADGLESPESTSTASPAATGQRFGDYDLLEVLGEGGMGTVWRARQRGLQREVALKVIRRGRLASDAERRRFQTEAEAAGSLGHPNIVPVHEVGEQDGQAFYSMKLVAGGNLAEHAARLGRDPEAGARLVARISRAVHHAHQRGILHRDLKPANILMDAGEPVVADFGLAKRMDAQTEATLEGSILGSPAYMSPEQATGSGADVSTASDIYSLGAVLCHLLTGAPPFQGDSPIAVLRQVIDIEPADVRRSNPHLDRDLAMICHKCLSKDPRGRYSSAEALAEDLERWLRREPVTARPPAAWERFARWIRRYPALASAAVGIVITAAIGAAAVRAQFRETQAALHRAEATARAERSARASVIPPLRTEHFNDEVWAARLSPDGSRLLVAAGPEAWIKDATSGATLRVLRGHTSYIRIARWSGDGRRVLTVSSCQQQPLWNHPLGPYGDQTARIWDTDSGQPVAVLQSPLQDPINAAAISEDGRCVALGAIYGGAVLWAPEDAHPLREWSPYDVLIRQMEFTPLGHQLLVTPGSGVWYVHRPNPGGGTFGSIGLHASDLLRVFDLDGLDVRFDLETLSRQKAPMWIGQGSNAPVRPVTLCTAVAAFSPDGRQIATAAGFAPDTALWDARDGRLLHRLEGHTSMVHAVAFSADGTRVVTGGADQTARVWATDTGRMLAVLEPHPREVTQVAFARNPRWVLTVCADRKLRVWDTREQVCVALLSGHQDTLHDAVFLPDGETVVSASGDGTLRWWRWATFEKLAVPLTGQSSAIRGLRLSPNSTRVVAGAADGTGRVWDLARGRLLFTLDPGPDYGLCEMNIRANGGGEMRDAAFSPDGQALFTVRTDPHFSRADNPLSGIFPRWGIFRPRELPFLPGRLWSSVDGHSLGGFVSTNLAFAGGEWSPDGTRVLLRSDAFSRRASVSGFWRFRSTSYSHGGGGPGGQAELFDVASSRRIALLQGHSSELRSALFSADGRAILTASEDQVQIWDAEGRSPVDLVDARGRDWTSFSRNGRLVLSEDSNRVPTLYDATTGEVVRRFDDAGRDLWEAWFDQDGSEIGTLTASGRLVAWSVADGSRVWEGQGSGANSSITIASPGGRWLATVVGGQNVDLWNLEDHRLVRTIERHVHDVTALAFSPDEAWLATGDSAGETWAWPLRLAIDREDPFTAKDTKETKNR